MLRQIYEFNSNESIFVKSCCQKNSDLCNIAKSVIKKQRNRRTIYLELTSTPQDPG